MIRQKFNMGKTKTGLKQKLLLPVAGLFILSIGIILFIVLAFSTKNTNGLSNQLMEEMNQRYASDIQGKLNGALDSAKALKPVLEQAGRTADRESDIALLKSILEQSEGVFGVYTLWEPNAYDGRDFEFKAQTNHDETGRFIPYVYRDTSGTETSALAGYTEAGVGDYYLVPKATGAECIINPFLYPLNGKDVYMSSMVVPLQQNGRFCGIVGMDILVDSLIESIQGVTLFETGCMFMADSNGTIFHHETSSLVGTSLYDLVGEEEGKLLTSALETGENIGFDFSMANDGTENRIVINPVSIGGQYWLVGSSVPLSEIQKATTNTILAGGGAGIVTLILSLLFLYFFISRIVKPLAPLTKAAYAIETGNIDSTVSGSLAAIKSKDEIGLLANSMYKAVGSIERVASDANLLSAAAEQHDLSVEIDTAAHSGIYRQIMDLINKLFTQLNDIVYSISLTTEQLAQGSEQVASGAQSLAQGATEQASAVEELHESLSTVSKDVQRNTDHVNLATEYVGQAANGLQKSNADMKALLTAMNDIKTSSDSIININKLIDDISFQTNILALNASVEAARAGAAGRGFSVVAEEVRNLASKSADAAKQILQLTQLSLRSVEDGEAIAQKTAESMNNVEKSAIQVEQTIAEITKASNAQSLAIVEITNGLNQISDVVQSNSSTAEESAAVSEELSSQIQTLYQDVSIYKFKK